MYSKTLWRKKTHTCISLTSGGLTGNHSSVTNVTVLLKLCSKKVGWADYDLVSGRRGTGKTIVWKRIKLKRKRIKQEKKKKRSLPIKRYFITQSFLHVSVERIVADICSCTCHPFDRDWTFPDIEIVVKKSAHRRRLPKELVVDTPPEWFGIVDRFFVKLFIFFQTLDVRLSFQRFRGLKQPVCFRCQRRHLPTKRAADWRDESRALIGLRGALHHVHSVSWMRRPCQG